MKTNRNAEQAAQWDGACREKWVCHVDDGILRGVSNIHTSSHLLLSLLCLQHLYGALQNKLIL